MTIRDLINELIEETDLNNEIYIDERVAEKNKGNYLFSTPDWHYSITDNLEIDVIWNE